MALVKSSHFQRPAATHMKSCGLVNGLTFAWTLMLADALALKTSAIVRDVANAGRAENAYAAPSEKASGKLTVTLSPPLGIVLLPHWISVPSGSLQ